MKKCPTCDKTFEDSMRFCQVDGTLLVDDEPAFDPYATIVAHKMTPENPSTPEIEIEPEQPLEADPDLEIAAEPLTNQTVGSVAISEPNDVLDLDQNDPLQTMYVSETDLRKSMDATDSEADLIEIPEIGVVTDPEPPSFLAPEVQAPPPSPFSSPENVPNDPEPEPADKYEEAVSVPPPHEEPVEEFPAFNEAATMIQPSFNDPFDRPAPAPIAEWTPPPPPDANWQNKEIGSNTPFQPPPSGNVGDNKTLAIISLVLGIVSLCCYVSPLTGLAAVVTGFMGMNKAKNEPDVYGGKGLAIAGMVLGGIFFLVGVIYWIFLLFFGGMAMIMDAAR